MKWINQAWPVALMLTATATSMAQGTDRVTLSELESSLADLEIEVAQQQSDLAELQNRTDAQDDELAAQNSVDELLQQQIDDLVDAITGQGDRLDGIDSELAALLARLSDLETRASSLEARDDVLATRIDELVARVDALEAQLEPLPVVFVTSQRYNGAIGGLSGADLRCNNLAAAAGLPGTFRAWLSDGTESPATRFNRSGFQRTDGRVVARDWADLTDRSLEAPISLDENGEEVLDSVWTATDAQGNAAGVNCQGWTSSAMGDLGSRGISPDTGDSWSLASGNAACSASLRLYCFEQ